MHVFFERVEMFFFLLIEKKSVKKGVIENLFSHLNGNSIKPLFYRVEC